MAAFALPFDRPRTVILAWPGDAPIFPRYGGEDIAIPPVTTVATEGRSIYRYGPAVDKQGKALAGTVLLKDVFRTDPSTASVVKAFDAEGWVKGLMSVNQKLFERGLCVVMDPDDVPAALEEGRKRWYKSKLAEWDNEVRTEDARRQKYRSQGQAPPPLDDKGEASLQNAILQLRLNVERAGSAISDAELRTALGGAAVVPTAPAAAPAPVPVVNDLAEAADELFRLCEQHDVKLLKEELTGLLKRDPHTMTIVEEKLTEAGVEL